MISSGRVKYLFYFLMVAYVVYLAASIVQIRSMLALASDQLIAALEDARDLRSRANELRNIFPALLSSPELDYENTEKELERQEFYRKKAVESLAAHYPGDPEAVEGLRKSFAAIREEARRIKSELGANSSYEAAQLRFNDDLLPHIRDVISRLNAIDISLASSIAELQAKIRFRLNLTLVLSVILGSLIIGAVIMASRREDAKNRELAWRDNLFAQLSDNVDEVFIVAQDASNFIYASPNSLRLLNLKPETLLANPSTLYGILANRHAADWLRETLDGGDLTSNEENVEINGFDRFFRITVYPLQDPGIKGGKFLISLADETAAVRQQEALRLALENAHAASAAKSGFLSHMSHEIRTPMNAIIGMTTIALAKLGNVARVRDCLEKISESSRHLLGLINDVLDMSKIESGKLSINSEPFSLDRTVASINHLVSPQAEAKKLQFRISLEDLDTDALMGDQLRLNQILLNLLSNALKFTPEGGKVSLAIRQLRKTGSRVFLQFMVADTGIGMSPEFLERIYTPFEQASSGTAAKYGGTGLGMPITASLVQLMGGSIAVESREGEGTVFTVDLSFGIDESASAGSSGLAALHVLVVDDDPGACEHAHLLLDKMGLDAEIAHSGQEAIRMVAEAAENGAPFNVCLVDWKMPGMDGAETARKIREAAGSGVLIIIVSAHDWSPIETEAREAGVNDFIAKPFFASTLHDALARATRKLEQENGQETGQPNFGGRRVLLVEDNEFNREIGQEFLEMAGIEVENAVNGQEAVQKFEASAPGHFNLILMDVQMPVMDGYEATMRIRAANHPEAKSMPILAMTANAFSEDVAMALASGMNGHLAKPIDVKKLYALLAEWLPKAD